MKSRVAMLLALVALLVPVPLSRDVGFRASKTITVSGSCGPVTVSGDSELLEDQVVREYLIGVACTYPGHAIQLTPLVSDRSIAPREPLW